LSSGSYSHVLRRISPSSGSLLTLFVLGLIATAIGVLAVPRLKVPVPISESVKYFQYKGIKIGLGVSPTNVYVSEEIDWSILKIKSPIMIERIVVGPRGIEFRSIRGTPCPPEGGKAGGSGSTIGGSLPPGRYRLIVRVYVVDDPFYAKLIQDTVKSVDWSMGEAAAEKARNTAFMMLDLLNQGRVRLLYEGSAEVYVQALENYSPANPLTLMGLALAAPATLTYGQQALRDERKRRIVIVALMTAYLTTTLALLPQVLAYDLENQDHDSEVYGNASCWLGGYTEWFPAQQKYLLYMET